jgi:predicted O-methyltransferase YrrM
MDTDGFARALADVYGGDPQAADVPAERTFAPIADGVAGWTTENGMALLNLAGRFLAEGEAYLEVGTFKGRSLCGAAHGAARGVFYGVENFREFFMDDPSARPELEANVARWTPPGRVRIVEADAFELLRRRGAVPEPVGVYFYDGAHERLAHYLALGVAEQHLADEALVVVDDASWPLVGAATRRYLRRHPGYEVVVELAAQHEDDPRWHNGVLVLRYRRPGGARRGPGWDVRWRLALYLWVQRPAMSWAWRFFPRHPRLARLAMTLVPQTSKNVPAGDTSAVPAREGAT